MILSADRRWRMKIFIGLAAAVLALQVEAQVSPAAGTVAANGPAGAGTLTIPPGTAARPANPGGLRGLPPPAVGRTFSRPVPSAPTNVVIRGFSPPAVTPGRLVATDAGIGGSPRGPVSVGNTVGENFLASGTNFPPSRPISVNLPPGATVRTNGLGVAADAETGAANQAIPPPAVRPPAAPIPSPPPPVRNPGARIPRVPTK